MKLTIALALSCLVTLAELALARHSASHAEWEVYKREHGKVYLSEEEDSMRFGLFLATKEKIRQHNKSASHTLALNHLSDWTQDELAKLRGLRYDQAGHMQRLELSAADPFLRALLEVDEQELPSEVDWRKVPERVSGVKNQKQCGSCWAFSTTGVLEGQQVARNITRQLVPLSEEDLVDCSENDSGCGGGLMSAALEDIHKLGGIESEKDYPYVSPSVSRCKFNKRKSVMTVKGSVDLPHRDELSLKKVVAQYGPVAIALEADELQSYHSGIFSSTTCTDAIDHGVLAVGYGTDPKHGDYWIVKNSWGAKWGEQGYFRLARGKGICGIGLLSTIPTF